MMMMMMMMMPLLAEGKSGAIVMMMMVMVMMLLLLLAQLRLRPMLPAPQLLQRLTHQTSCHQIWRRRCCCRHLHCRS